MGAFLLALERFPIDSDLGEVYVRFLPPLETGGVFPLYKLFFLEGSAFVHYVDVYDDLGGVVTGHLHFLNSAGAS